MFEISQRDGLGRVTAWSLGNTTITTPNIFFITSERLKPFPEAEIYIADHSPQTTKPYILDSGSKFSTLIDKGTSGNPELTIPADLGYPLSCNELYEDMEEYSEDTQVCVIHNYSDEELANKINPNAELYVLGNAIELSRSPRAFIAAIIKVKNAIGYPKPLYAPAIGAPNQFALLIYCGVDLFDTTQLILKARDGVFLSDNGSYSLDTISDVGKFCYCPACKAAEDDTITKFGFEHILHHNYYSTLSELGAIRAAIYSGALREHVEQRARSEPWLSSVLKTIDHDHYDFQELYLPLTRRSKLIAVSSDAIGRPEVKRFRVRLKARYRKPASAKVLLLLPCSARKPYSNSKSHKWFRQALLNSANPSVVHDVILTSPLGLVPRELELAYPAQQYDIPVTGVWDHIEKAMIELDLKWLIENNQYDNIVVHLNGELLEIVAQQFQTLNIDIIKTCNGSHPTSQNALKNLTINLTEVAQEYDHVPQQERLREYMLNRLKFQFGEIGANLLENGEIIIKGKYPNLKLFRDKNQLGMLIAERGMISLTLEGAKVLAESRSFWVEIDDFQPKGSVMAVGVVEADPAIRIEDEVVIIHKNELRGVGKAAMSVPEILKSVRGVAVKVRHHT